MYKAMYLSPMIPSFQIESTAKFFTDILDFSPVQSSENYIICQKDNLTIHILKAGEDVGQMEFYLEIDNIDNLWAVIKGRLEDIQVKSPIIQHYGMKEIHIIIPHTKTLLFIGQELK